MVSTRYGLYAYRSSASPPVLTSVLTTSTRRCQASHVQVSPVAGLDGLGSVVLLSARLRPELLRHRDRFPEERQAVHKEPKTDRTDHQKWGHTALKPPPR